MTQHPPGGTPGFHGNRLVRPATGRYVAGVCAALGRATRTDPVLWRVVLAVLVCFGGTGILAYIGLWLLTPEDGDSASPLEMLFGRGQSGTSPVSVALLGVLAVLALVFVLVTVGPVYLALLGAAALVVAVLLSARSAAPPPGQPGPPGQQPAPPGEPEPPQQEPSPQEPSPQEPSPQEPSPQDPSAHPAPPTPATHTAPPAPETSLASSLASPAPSPPRGEPLAPHGPFAGLSAPQAPPAETATGPAAAPRPPRPPRPPSRLPWVTLCAILTVLGGLGLAHALSPLDLRPSAYVVAALAVTGAGLVVGAWWGRARSLIALGIVVTLALPVVHVVEIVRAWEPAQPVGTSVVWDPADITDLDDTYGVALGDGRLDLRSVDFSAEEVHVAVSVEAGELQVLVPPGPDVRVETAISFGNAMLFGERYGGMGASPVVTDPTPGTADPRFSQPVPAPPDGDDPGRASTTHEPGTLTLDLEVRFGNATVERR